MTNIPTTFPSKALLSFGRSHCAWAIARLAQQIQRGHLDEKKGLRALSACLETLTEHSDQKLAHWAWEQKNLLPSRGHHLEKWVHGLETLGEENDMVTKRDKEKTRGHPPQIVDLVLDNIRSALNVGVLLRSAEALGVGKIYLCGYTPTPDNPKVAKTALGSEGWVSWEYRENTLECLKSLVEGPNPRILYALETHQKATDISSFCPTFPCALILGNERFGLGEVILKASHRILAFHLYGRKNSLNVAVCASMAIHHFLCHAYSETRDASARA